MELGYGRSVYGPTSEAERMHQAKITQCALRVAELNDEAQSRFGVNLLQQAPTSTN